MACRVVARESIAESELDHRDHGDQEDCPDDAQDEAANKRARFGSDAHRLVRAHFCHREVRACSTEYAHMTTTMTTIIPSASAPAMFSRPNTVSLTSVERIWRGTI